MRNGFNTLFSFMIDSGPKKDIKNPIYINKQNLFKEINSLAIAVILDQREFLTINNLLRAAKSMISAIYSNKYE